MQYNRVLSYVNGVLDNLPSDWLNLTTHRLDIYEEKLAKSQFLERLEVLCNHEDSTLASLKDLPTAFDYIRLGHPLSCVLEWTIARSLDTDAENVITFSSQTTPILAILRNNLLEGRKTRILSKGELPSCFDADVIRSVYAYNFEVGSIDELNSSSNFDGSTILISEEGNIYDFNVVVGVDFYINTNVDLGSVIWITGDESNAYISEVQHVRRRETIAMTPINCLAVLKGQVAGATTKYESGNVVANKASVVDSIHNVTGTETKALVGSSGLSIQYAIMMGLIHDANEKHPGKEIKIVVPPNCYGGTNDQARRIAACIKNVEVVDLPVDGGSDMVKSIDTVLSQLADVDAVPYIIAEIPTNPRVEVPDLEGLRDALSKERKTKNGDFAVDPVFILDQTFCPNVRFLGSEDMLSSVRTISYSSGSKFPSGGRCTAGYCIANEKADSLMNHIEDHLDLCDNEATALQYEILAEQMPSMITRIADAYKNTREYVTFINEVLPDAKINFVSDELAEQGFTPSVFSLDLPTKGETKEEQEKYKRALNLKLINMMITSSEESKFCVSYGQLKGCYWTIPATSTQGTTKEKDKDYIVRASLSPDLDLKLHKAIFLEFVKGMKDFTLV